MGRTTSEQIDSVYGDNRSLLISSLGGPAGSVTLHIRDAAHGNGGITVSAAAVAKALAEQPGWAVTYTQPIAVPTYLGAVVEREHDGVVPTQRFVRVRLSSESSVPWVSAEHGTTRSDDDIAAVLANGGYERQPEFPRNG